MAAQNPWRTIWEPSEPVTVDRRRMDDFVERVKAVEKESAETATALRVHLSVFEQMQNHANVKMNFVLVMVGLLLVATLLGPRAGLLSLMTKFG
ncbi:MAG TPA: hypothetical protein VMV33_17060 [Rhodocyclaceae bacterium]|nr:hypothetical protein [Rhodocyclaceae bacterium]